MIEVLVIYHYLPMKKDITLHLNNFESPLANDALCQAWLNLAK